MHRRLVLSLATLFGAILLAGCETATTEVVETGLVETITPVDLTAVVLEIRRTSLEDFKPTITSEIKVKPGDTFATHDDEDLFRAVEIKPSGSVIIEEIASSESTSVGVELTDVIVETLPQIHYEMRVLRIDEPFAPTADPVKAVQKTRNRAAHVTVDDVGSVQEIIFDPGAATNNDLALAAQFPNLRKLVAPAARFNASGLRKLQKLSRLLELDLSNTDVSSGQFDVITEFQSLETLILNDAKFDHADLKKVADLNDLLRLSLKGAGIPMSVIWSLRQDMPSCLIEGESQMKWGVLQTAAGNRSVVDLARDSSYGAAARANALLMGVSLVENEAGEVVSADASHHAEHSPTLASHAIFSLRGFARLKRLDLSYSNCGGEGLLQLRNLALNGLNNRLDPILLEELNLAGVQAPAEAWVDLTYHYRLKRLDLSNTNVSDEAIKRLSGMRGLESLNVAGVSASPQAIEFLARRLPDAKIVTQP